MAGHAYLPRPRDVPGYAEAVAVGRTPARSPRPPAVLPGTTAHQALVRCGVVLGGAALLVVVALASGTGSGGQASFADLGRMLGATAVGIGAMLVAIGRFRRALLRELAAGYVTTTFHQGLFWFTKRPGPVVANNLVGWDWRGLWVLRGDGSVVSAPDPDTDPPGFYPSPHRAGQLELWTGSQWIGVHPGR